MRHKYNDLARRGMLMLTLRGLLCLMIDSEEREEIHKVRTLVDRQTDRHNELAALRI